MINTNRSSTVCRCALILSGLLHMLCSALAGKPADIYLQGYLKLSDAKRLEESGKHADAYRTYRKASDIFDSVARDFPNWSPEMLAFRRKKIRESIRISAEKAGIDLGAAEAGRLRDPRDPSGITRPPGATNLNIEQQFRNLKRKIRQLSDERHRLADELGGKEDELRKTRESLKKARKMEEGYRKALAESEAKLAETEGNAEQVAILKTQVADLTKQLGQANKSLREANDRTAAVLAELEKANDQIADLKMKQEAFAREKQQISAIIKGLDSDDATIQLVEQNRNLREELNAAQAQLDQLTQDKEGANQKVLKLRSDLSKLRTELAHEKKANEEYRLQIEDLKGRLTTIMEEQTITPPNPDEAEALAENVLLKKIILRQLKQQTRRQQAKQLVMEELAKMESDSTTLLTQIENMASGTRYSDKEKETLATITNDPKIHDAVNAAEQLANIDNENVRKRLIRDQKAAAYDYEQGNFESAELLYTQILEFAPQNLHSLCNLGLVKRRLNKLQEARKMFEKALVYDEGNAFAHFMLGVTDNDLENFEGAMAAINHAIKLDPSNAMFRYNMGTLCLDRGDVENAEKHLKEVLKINPTHAPTLFNLAVCYVSHEPADGDSARLYYQRARANGSTADPKMEILLDRL